MRPSPKADHHAMKKQIAWEDFAKIEMRVGTVLSSELFKEARKPALKLMIDFGNYGIKKSSAQLTNQYRPEELIGKQLVAVVNFPPKQIATLKSECLVLGAVGENGEVTLMQPERPVPDGTRIG